MVGRKLWRKRISPRYVIRVRGRTEQPGCVSVAPATERFPYLWVRELPIDQGFESQSGFPKGYAKLVDILGIYFREQEFCKVWVRYPIFLNTNLR